MGARQGPAVVHREADVRGQGALEPTGRRDSTGGCAPKPDESSNIGWLWGTKAWERVWLALPPDAGVEEGTERTAKPAGGMAGHAGLDSGKNLCCGEDFMGRIPH